MSARTHSRMPASRERAFGVRHRAVGDRHEANAGRRRAQLQRDRAAGRAGADSPTRTGRPFRFAFPKRRIYDHVFTFPIVSNEDECVIWSTCGVFPRLADALHRNEARRRVSGLAPKNRGPSRFLRPRMVRDELAKHGLTPNMAQLNVGFSHKQGTIRGLHYQVPPHAEAKFVRCTRGAIFDVIVDLRRDSPTRGQWFGAELTADNALMLYAPEGFAHGYQTLADDTEAYYLTSACYAPAAARGVRYNEPAFGIAWPLAGRRGL